MIYRDKVLQLLDIVLTKARNLRVKFDESASLKDLLSHFDKLERDYQKFEESIPEDFTTGSQLSRHYTYLKQYLREHKQQNCHNDIKDICDRDIEQFREDYLRYLIGKGVDKELNKEIFPLLQNNHCDSAVRKSFVVLTERLRSSFLQPRNVDGRVLVNNIFGKSGILSDKIEKDESESLRNLFDGMYGAFRNDVMHNDVEIDVVEAEGIISMINVLLKKIEKLKTKI